MNTLPSLSQEELGHAVRKLDALAAAMNQVLFGKEDLIELVLIGVLARGHILLEGLPGLGKTELVKGLSRALALTARRVQFTPDLLPGDITGTPARGHHGHSRPPGNERGKNLRLPGRPGLRQHHAGG